MRTFRQSLVCIAALVMAGVANAQIVATGPFTGSMFDDFESYPHYGIGGVYSSLPVMGGGGTFNSASGTQVYIYHITDATWGLGGYGGANVTSGHQGLGLYNNLTPIDVTLNFATPVVRFGGMMATDSNQGGFVKFDFYDASNVHMGSHVFDSGCNVMQWQGWVSLGNPIAYIRFSNNWAPVMDDITADIVPEPATLLAIGAGLAALARRRR